MKKILVQYQDSIPKKKHKHALKEENQGDRYRIHGTLHA
jgi:hypothetical protein